MLGQQYLPINMSYDKNRPGNKGKFGNKLRIVFLSIFCILILSNLSGAMIDCSMCHKTEPGTTVIKAINTIEINNQTCLKCHNPAYPPTPMGYNTHLAHVGKYSSNVNYFLRHPDVNGRSCDSCHTNIGQNCQTCHVKGIPHIQPPLGLNCKGCHNELDNLFRHPIINLKIHNIFNASGISACTMCHNPDNVATLKLASGDSVSILQPHKLCYQCHSGYYNLWNSGQHYVNNTIPTDAEIIASNGVDADISGIRADLEDKWQNDNTCVNCHNPHNPSELYQLPTVGSKGLSAKTVIGVNGPNLLYILAIVIIIIILVAVFIIKKRKIKLSELPKLKMPRLKIPSIKMPKISIPISISVEKLDKESVDTHKEDEGVRKEDEGVHNKHADIEIIIGIKEFFKKVGMKLKERIKRQDIDAKPKSKTFIYRYKKDILFLSSICVMLGIFYIVFGSFVPIDVVASESMSPHINVGDVVFYTDISRIDNIMTHDINASYQSFGDYGDVILYKPLGQEGASPYVHRVMYYVKKGDNMWLGGPPAPYDGYITKGDNTITNQGYDQQLSISYQKPVKKEWVVGIARFRIPYIGYIRLLI